MATSAACRAVLFTGFFIAAGCSDPRVAAQVQHAVATGAQGALAALPAGAQNPSPSTGDSATLPASTRTGDGLRFGEDQAHQDPSAVRTPSGWAVVWTDPSHQVVYFGRTDRNGSALGSPRGVELRHADTEEETVSAPAVLSVADGALIAWVDADNGRVLTRRVNSNGAVSGPTVIVHEGLEAPRAVRLSVQNGEYGLAVALWHGVYFARVTANGSRIGDGVMVSEGEPVSAIESLRAENGQWTLSWRGSPNGPLRTRALSSTELHSRAATAHTSLRGVGSAS